VNILLIEPKYRSKFPPLGLMRISRFHKERGDAVSFKRGKVPELRMANWHRIYISTLFTYELPRTVKTIEYYSPSVANPATDIFVGGIGATLLPKYINERVSCRVIRGALDKENMLGLGESPIAEYIPDYDMLDSVEWKYKPEDAYFIRVSIGCIRKCKFCAVPILEPKFGYLQNVPEQLRQVKEKFGERQNLVILDNNILALDCFPEVVDEIRNEGFERGAKFNGQRKRAVDFNQGIDARLITPDIAKLLSSICVSPVRLAFDFDGMESEYRQAVRLLADVGFIKFTTYVMFNFDDTPESFYHRLKVNLELSQQLSIRVTGFPMRYVPIQDVDRHHISKNWTWRYLRGIQCILNATHGMVSPNPEFFEAAFGRSPEEFREIVTMPDRYIIYRNDYRSEADEWRNQYHKLSDTERQEFLVILERLHKSKRRKEDIAIVDTKFGTLLEHYYPKQEKGGAI
jgi:hypothetical protein